MNDGTLKTSGNGSGILGSCGTDTESCGTSARRRLGRKNTYRLGPRSLWRTTEPWLVDCGRDEASLSSPFVAEFSVMLPIASESDLVAINTPSLYTHPTIMYSNTPSQQRLACSFLESLSTIRISLLPSADRTSEHPTATVCSTLCTSASDGFTS